MSYFTVLGYTDNHFLSEHEEKYFQLLLGIYSTIKVDKKLKKLFSGFSGFQQRQFLLHPDISSLLQDILSPASLQKFSLELDYFCNNQRDKLTFNLGEKISGTNILLTLHDNNPQNMEVGHPDHDTDGMIGWGSKSQQEWLDVFEKSFYILKNTDSGFFNELNKIIKKIVPMKTSIDVHNSCSYKDCIGTLYLGYTVNSEFPEYTILEALIHESSHNKLNLIMQSERLLLNNHTLCYYSPYRPDARHIHGVLLGVHAIVATVYVLLLALQKGYIDDNFIYNKVLLNHTKNKLGYRVLKNYGKFTQKGSKILRDIGQVILLCDELIKYNPKFQNISTFDIQNQARNHFMQVKNSTLNLKY